MSLDFRFNPMEDGVGNDPFDSQYKSFCGCCGSYAAKSVDEFNTLNKGVVLHITDTPLAVTETNKEYLIEKLPIKEANVYLKLREMFK